MHDLEGEGWLPIRDDPVDGFEPRARINNTVTTNVATDNKINAIVSVMNPRSAAAKRKAARRLGSGR
jgi:hypothetical protein